MKHIGYILSVYLILLAVVPCCRFDNCSDKEITTQTTHEEEKSCGNCSPFFNCEGCATASVGMDHTVFETLPLSISTVYNLYLHPSLPDNPRDFWQPPRLS
jgi:hypothetical protein